MIFSSFFFSSPFHFPHLSCGLKCCWFLCRNTPLLASIYPFSAIFKLSLVDSNRESKYTHWCLSSANNTYVHKSLPYLVLGLTSSYHTFIHLDGLFPGSCRFFLWAELEEWSPASAAPNILWVQPGSLKRSLEEVSLILFLTLLQKNGSYEGNIKKERIGTFPRKQAKTNLPFSYSALWLAAK